MPEVIVDQAPIVIGAEGLEEIAQNIRMIVLTHAGSEPLHRDFAHAPDYVDAPSPLEAARRIGALTQAIEKWEPRVKVERISLERRSDTNAALGALLPRVTFSLREA